MIATFRPLPVWPYPPTRYRRSRVTFRASWQNTLDLLSREVEAIGGSAIIIAAGFEEGDIRLDGMPRANARYPAHPGVEVSFDSKHGRLVYGTDTCELWQHNVRSIALGLMALRKVDLYGITRKGEQYAGWKQLTTAAPDADRGRELVIAAGSLKQALLVNHPDHGGDPRNFADVQAYRSAGGS
jgi:hypothetical protein